MAHNTTIIEYVLATGRHCKIPCQYQPRRYGSLSLTHIDYSASEHWHSAHWWSSSWQFSSKFFFSISCVIEASINLKNNIIWFTCCHTNRFRFFLNCMRGKRCIRSWILQYRITPPLYIGSIKFFYDYFRWPCYWQYSTLANCRNKQPRINEPNIISFACCTRWGCCYGQYTMGSHIHAILEFLGMRIG